MWTHTSLCQLASELDNGHRHVLCRCSLSLSLLHQAFALLSVCLSLQISRIHLLFEVRHLSELLTDQSFPWFDLFPLLFGSVCLALPSCARLVYWTMKLSISTSINVYCYFCAMGHPSSIYHGVYVNMREKMPNAVKSHIPQGLFQFIDMTQT